MLKRFCSYYKPHLRLFLLDMGAALCVALAGQVYPVLTRMMLNDFIPNRAYREVIVAGGVLLCIYFVRFALNYFIQYYGHIMGLQMQAQMRRELFAHIEKLPYSFFDGQDTGKIMSRLTNDLFDITELAHHGPENLLISGATLVIAFVYLSTIHLYLTLILFACVPLLLLVSVKLKNKRRRAFADSRVAIAEINAATASSISGIRVTRAFDNAEKEKEKFEKGNLSFVSSRRRAYRAMAQFHSTNMLITDVFNVIVLLCGGIFLYRGDITFGDYSAFILSVVLFTKPVMTLVDFTESFEEGITGFTRFAELMDEEEEKDDGGAVPLASAKGEITLSHVSSSYEGSREVLHDVSFTVGAGETFALVGPSGGGKTTICHLIPRFYEWSAGSILLDGQDIRRYTKASLRRQIGIVQQDVFLFNASIKDNILYGRLDATDDEVIEAAKRADIHEEIMRLPDGYDTQIGERGVRLSGGQKQRLSIARVFLKNPPILILDEATSALDNATEIQIQGALDSLAKGRTTLVVAHRLSTVKNASRIAVIADGNLKECGTHDALVAQGGLYASLYRLQFRE